MRTFNEWMAEYGVSHKHPTNQIIHKIFVPLIMLSVIGIIWSIPTPDFFKTVPYLNWATIFSLGCLIFYISLNFLMFLGMLFLTSLMCFICQQLEYSGILLQASIIIFLISWIFQFYGHKVEGKKPSFIQDLAFLLIGPLWVLRFFYSKVGIKV
jgi:uncharacterized membrane protein YGL010W